MSLKWIADRWSCSRQTCRRILEQHSVRAFYLGGDSRNATVRFDLLDVIGVEARSQLQIERLPSRRGSCRDD